MGLTAEANLIGRWAMNESTASATATDSSTTGNDGTPYGTSGTNNLPQPQSDVPTAVSDLTYSRNFDGTDDRIYIANNAAYEMGSADQWSFGGWFKNSYTSSVYQRMMVYQSGGSAKLWQVRITNTGGLQTEVRDSTYTLASASYTSADVRDGTWHHVFVVVDASAKTLKLYLDGTLETTTSSTGWTGDFSSSYPIYLGSFNGTSTEAHHGNQVDWRLYDTALTDADVGAIHAGDLATLADEFSDAIALWYPGYGYPTSGTTVEDRTASANDMTLTNGPTWSLDDGAYSISMDGSNDYCTAGDVLDIGTGDYSISVWFKTPATISSTQHIAGKFADSTYDGMRLYFSSGLIGLRAADYTVTYSSTLSTSTWYHLVGTLDRDSSTGLKLYVNGTLQATGDPSAGSADDWQTTKPWTVGIAWGTGYSQYAEIKWDEILVFDRALDSADVTHLYNGGTRGGSHTERSATSNGGAVRHYLQMMGC